MSGTGLGTFSPDIPMTRAMFVTVLSKLAGADVSSYKTSSFGDVGDKTWYAPYIEWAYQNGLSSGIGGGNFGPDNPVTREQLVLFLKVYLESTNHDTTSRADISTYIDVSSVSSWALDAMQWAVYEGLISGTSQDTLSPGQNATRAQVAQIIMNFNQRYN